MKRSSLKLISSLMGLVTMFELVQIDGVNTVSAKSNLSVAAKVSIGLAGTVALGAIVAGGIALGVGLDKSKSEDSKKEDSKEERIKEIPYRVEPCAPAKSYIDKIISDSKIKISNFEIVKTGGKCDFTGITDSKLLSRKEYGKVGIIDAANRGGLGGGGVDGAIFSAMSENGCEPENEIEKSVPCYPGSNDRIHDGGAVIHSSYGIEKTCPNVPYVIQTVSPVLNDDENLPLFYSAWYRAVELGIKSGCDTLVTAAVGMGAFCANDKLEFAEKCAGVAAQAINDARRDCKKNIKIVLTDHQDNRRKAAFFDALEKMIK